MASDLRRWLSQVANSVRSTRPTQPCWAPTKLALEPLEPRLALATFTATSFLDLGFTSVDLSTGAINDGGANDGQVTLRSALFAANQSVGVQDTIVLPNLGGLYRISIAGAGEDSGLTGDFDILDDVIITGATGSATVAGLQLDRVFDIAPGVSATLNNIWIGTGLADRGGGILVRSNGHLTYSGLVADTEAVDPDLARGGGFFLEAGATFDVPAGGAANFVRAIARTTAAGGMALGGAIYITDGAFGGFAGSLTVASSQATSAGDGAFAYGGGLYVAGGTLTSVSNLTINSNSVELTATGDGGVAAGGAIYLASTAAHSITGATILSNVVNSTDTTNTASMAYGGGIYSAGDLTLENVTIANNLIDIHGGVSGAAGYGAGVASFGDLTIRSSQFIGNQVVAGDSNVAEGAGAYGGGVFAFGAAVIERSTITGNQARNLSANSTAALGAFGGGIYASDALTLVNSTLSGNVASAMVSPGFSSGGGMFVEAGALAIRNSTIVNNRAESASSVASGGGIEITASGASRQISSSLIAANTVTGVTSVGPNILGAATSLGFNVIGSVAGATITPLGTDTFGAADVLATLGVAALANNGGPVFTHALLPTATLLLDQGTDNGLATDARGTGFARVIGAAADVGAFEAGIFVASAVTDEEVQTSGLAVTLQPNFTHFKVTNVLNGAVFLNDGVTAVASGSFVTAAQVTAGLRFTPAVDFFGAASFDLEGATTNNDGGLTGEAGAAVITVNPVADTPTVTNATTSEGVQTASGLVISRNVNDTAEVTHFKITNILNGTLFLNDGVTQIVAGTFVSFAQANAGLRFTPTPGFVGAGSFDIQASLSNSDTGLGGSVITATITVTGVAGTPTVTNASTLEDVQTTSGLVLTATTGGTLFYKITAIASGTLFLNDGVTAVASGAFITAAQGATGLRFTPSSNVFGTGSFEAQASTSADDSGLASSVVTATITIAAVADTPSVSSATTNENVQTTIGLVISRSAADGAEVTHFKITNIQNGTLFSNDGVTPIVAGSFITFAQANAGLRFTPAAGLSSPSSAFRFDVQASLSDDDTGLGGATATATITVVPDFVPVRYFAVSADGGSNGSGPHVVVYDASTRAIAGSFFAFDPGFRGGVRVAVGDVNGDSVDDIIVGQGKGGGQVRVIDGTKLGLIDSDGQIADAAILVSIAPFGTSFKAGVYVAAGDFNRDGQFDIVVGAGAGRPGRVRVFDGETFARLADLKPFGSSFTGGVTVAAGDINGDGVADIIVGRSLGNSRIKTYSGDGFGGLGSFNAFKTSFTSGVFVSTGDVNGDGQTDIIVGAGAGSKPIVRIFDGASRARLASLQAFSASFRGGVRVAAVNADSDVADEILLAPGPGSQPRARLVNLDASLVDQVMSLDGKWRGGLFGG